jgi:hypothetical protein
VSAWEEQAMPVLRALEDPRDHNFPASRRWSAPRHSLRPLTASESSLPMTNSARPSDRLPPTCEARARAP